MKEGFCQKLLSNDDNNWTTDKSQNISICKCEISGGVNSIINDLQTCNLCTGQYVSYKFVKNFRLNLPQQNGKTFFTSNVKTFHICKWISFAVLTFFQCRRNAFSSVIVRKFKEEK